MKRRIPILLFALSILALTGILSGTDLSAGDRPDDTPFGFYDHFWYLDRSTHHTELDRSVPEAFGKLGGDASLEVVIQFNPPMTDSDIRAAEDAGFTIIHRMTAIPAVFARGGRDAIERIARYPGTYWIENNTRLEFLMEKTTTVI